MTVVERNYILRDKPDAELLYEGMIQLLAASMLAPEFTARKYYAVGSGFPGANGPFVIHTRLLLEDASALLEAAKRVAPGQP